MNKQLKQFYGSTSSKIILELESLLVEEMDRNSTLNLSDALMTEFICHKLGVAIPWVIPGIALRLRTIRESKKILNLGLDGEILRAFNSCIIILNIAEMGSIEWGYVLDVTHIVRAINKYFLASLAGLLEKFLKYQTCYLAARGFNNVELPERPDELPFEEKDGFIIGGGFDRFLRCIFKVLERDSLVNSRRARLAWSFMQVKRASDPAPEDFIIKNMEKHKIRLTKIDETEDLVVEDELHDEVIRTVDEIFKGKFRSHRERIRIPSSNAHYECPRSIGGALGKFFCTSQIGSLVLLKMYETIPGRVKSLYVYVCDDDYKYVYRRAHEDAVRQEKVDCIPHPILEPFKVRVITLGTKESYWVAKNYQDLIWDVLRKTRTFRFIGQPCTSEDLDDIFGVFEYDENNTFVSIDYEAATDNLDPFLSSVALERVMHHMHVPLEDRMILHRCLTKHRLHYKHDGSVVDQEWGQLMGSPISFPILCLVNAAVLRAVLEKANGRKQFLTHTPLVVNGDDGLALIPKGSYDLLKDYTNRAGLKFSLGKNYLLQRYCVINSSLYEARPRVDYFGVKRYVFDYLPYINMGLLTGKSRVQDSKYNKRDPFSGTDERLVLNSAGPTIGAKHRALVSGLPREMQERLTTLFIRNNLENLKLVRDVSWWIPQHLGGLGMQWVSQGVPNITPFQAKMAAYLECANTPETLLDRKVMEDRMVKPCYLDYAYKQSLDMVADCGFTFEKTEWEVPDLSRYFVNLCDGTDTESEGSRFSDSFYRIFYKAQATALLPMSWDAIRQSRKKPLYLRRPFDCSMV